MTAAGTSSLFRIGPRRPLPRTCRPAQDETTGSYVLRLAHANRLDPAELVDYLTGGASTAIGKISLAALAVASGQPTANLAYALPQMRDQHHERAMMALRGRTRPAKPNVILPACRQCTAIRFRGARVDLWCRHDHTICPRHQLWIGAGVQDPRDQVDLAAHGVILHALARHQRLIRRHGHGIVRTAYTTARQIWTTLTYRGWGLPHAIGRGIPLPAGFGHTDWPAHDQDPVHRAATYPEVITLTQMLVSPHWRPFAISLSSTDRDRFHTEFRRRLPDHIQAIAGRDLQLLAHVRYAPAIDWHQPTSEIIT